MKFEVRLVPVLMAFVIATYSGNCRSALPAADLRLNDVRLQLSEKQRSAIGVDVSTSSAAETSEVLLVPARVVLPPSAQRVVATPVSALVERLYFASGEPIRAGSSMAQLQSLQAQELGREAKTSESQFRLAESEFNRDELLFNEGLISKARLEASRAAKDQAFALREERRRAFRATGSGPEGVVISKSPIGGMVLEQLVTVGQRVEANTPLYRVASLDSVWIEMSVSPEQAESLEIGDSISLPNRVGTGKVIALAGLANDSTQMVTIRATYRGEAPPRPGLLLEAEVHRKSMGRLSFPSTALSEYRGRTIVFLEAGQGIYRPLAVHGVRRRGATASALGLTEGSRVVSSGTAALRAMLDIAPK